jgi:hypothetical protein
MRNAPMTFRRVSNLLRTLGFEKQVGEGFILFRHAPQDAVIVLPVYEPTAVVRPAHRLGIEKTVVGKGVVTEEQWQRHLVAAMRPVRRARSTHKKNVAAV